MVEGAGAVGRGAQAAVLAGSAEFGDPCRHCGYRWTLPVDQILGLHAEVHHALAAITERQFAMTADGLGWAVGGYVCHIGDNERIWAERFAGAVAHRATVRVAPFDQDRLATARRYGEIPYASAMWALRRAFEECTVSAIAAVANDTVLVHPERGTLSAVDALATIVHDCHHHLWDIGRIVANQP